MPYLRSIALSFLSFLLVSPPPISAQLGFDAPSIIDSNADSDTGFDDDIEPRIATDGAGTWIAVWASEANLGGTVGSDYDIFFARSTDNGASWSTTATLNSNADSDSGNDVGPAIATDRDGNWIVVWHSNEDLSSTGTDFDILYSCSTNGGVTWSNPATLNSTAGSDSENDFDPSIACDGSDHWVVVWWSDHNFGGTSGSDRDVFTANSSNDGTSWSTTQVLNSNADSDSGTDRSGSVATDGAGNWVAAWWSNENLNGSLETDADILFSRSTDNGASWSDVAPLLSVAYTDFGDDLFPHLATNSMGTWIAVFESDYDLNGTAGTDRDIFVARSTDGGATWGALQTLNSSADSDSGFDHGPIVVGDDPGYWLVVWHSEDTLGDTIGTDHDILVTRSSDDGLTWEPLEVLNSNAASDSLPDRDPWLATDGSGNWVAVWSSAHDFSGTAGNDRDIAASTSNSVPVEMTTFLLE